MNWKQKICLWIGIAIIVAMGIYPPWQIRWKTGEEFGGYSFILGQPCRKEFKDTDIVWGAYEGHLDALRLFAQWIMVAVVTGGLIATFADKKDKKPKDD